MHVNIITRPFFNLHCLLAWDSTLVFDPQKVHLYKKTHQRQAGGCRLLSSICKPAVWWAGPLTCSTFFPHASIFDVQHVAGNSLGAPGALILSRHSCQKAGRHHVRCSSLIYCAAFMAACLCNAIVQRHLQSTPRPFEGIPTPTDQNRGTPSNPVKSLFTDVLVRTDSWRGKRRETRRRREEAFMPCGSGLLQELLYSAIVKELGEIIGLPSSMCNLHFNEPHSCSSFNI